LGGGAEIIDSKRAAKASPRRRLGIRVIAVLLLCHARNCDGKALLVRATGTRLVTDAKE
jgi:hypothetical protein